MTVLLIEPGKTPRHTEIDGSLTGMQQVVGGYIQAIYPFEDPVALICNEEGKLLGLPLNRALKDEDGDIYDIIAGTFFLCGAPQNNTGFTSLKKGFQEKCEERLGTPEVFLKLEDCIPCIPKFEEL